MSIKMSNPILVDFNTLSSRSKSGAYVPAVPEIVEAGTKFVQHPGRSASEVGIPSIQDRAPQAESATASTASADD